MQAWTLLTSRLSARFQTKTRSSERVLITNRRLWWYRYEAIMAYYLSSEGLSEFEREGHNLRASLSRHRQLYLGGHMDQAEFDTQALHIGRQLQGLKPSARTEAQEILPQLQNFPELWAQLTNGEKRNLLKKMFQVIYFDSQGKMREVVAHAPFKELLGL